MGIDKVVEIFAKNFPDKKINGDIVEFKGKYAASLIPKNGERDPWDSTITAIDKTTGEISQFSAFEDSDFIDAKPIKGES